MPLTKEQVDKIRDELDNCKNPLFFFHDDPDGLCSFLLLYKYKGDGHGVIVKRATPTVDGQFVSKVAEYNADKVFILDIAVVDQEFVDSINVPVIWIDHHQPLELTNTKIFNPRIKNKDDGTPVTYMCHQVVQENIWIAAVGCIGDWYIPDFMDEFKKEYPGMVEMDSKDPGDILFETKLGYLVRIFSFVLKGKTSDVKKCFKVLTRVKEPDEILKQKSSQGKFVYRKFLKINEGYTELIEAGKKCAKDDDELLLYIYNENKMSFSSDLSNELLHRYPKKLIIVGRDKQNEVKMSLRYYKPVRDILKKALIGVEGYGGGHECACGANVKKDDFKRFIESIREQI
jgi:single-stranded DNA-specific DHH superfamily exonuclease